MTVTYEVVHPGSPAAGLSAYYNTVAVHVEYDPGGEPGEFAGHVHECLDEWFDGAQVTRKEEDDTTE